MRGPGEVNAVLDQTNQRVQITRHVCLDLQPDSLLLIATVLSFMLPQLCTTRTGHDVAIKATVSTARNQGYTLQRHAFDGVKANGVDRHQ